MISIRPATIEDAVAISSLTETLARDFIAPDCTEEGAARLLESMSAEATRARFEAGYRYFVAVDDAQTVGVVATRDDSHLFHLFVASSHQRQGLARELWRIAREACLAAGNPGVFTVNSSRRSRAVYESFGFVAQAETTQNGVPYIPMTLRIGPAS